MSETTYSGAVTGNSWADYESGSLNSSNQVTAEKMGNIEAAIDGTKLYHVTYTGNGSTSKTITFEDCPSFKPYLIIVSRDEQGLKIGTVNETSLWYEGFLYTPGQTQSEILVRYGSMIGYVNYSLDISSNIHSFTWSGSYPYTPSSDYPYMESYLALNAEGVTYHFTAIGVAS